MIDFATCILIRNAEGKYLGVARRGTTDEWGFPGGKVEPNEMSNIGMKFGALRELYEETGYKFIADDLNYISPIYVDNCGPGTDGKTFRTKCFRLSVHDVFSSSDCQGDAGPVEWIDKEQLIRGPFGEYNLKVFESIEPPSSDSQLLSNIKLNLPALKTLLHRLSSKWDYEDYVYRYYHNSFKLYFSQPEILRVVDEFKFIAGYAPLNKTFQSIIYEGTKNKFDLSHNKEWDNYTDPILKALFHTKYMLEMMVKYGEQYTEAPNIFDSGWGSVLYLFNMR